MEPQELNYIGLSTKSVSWGTWGKAEKKWYREQTHLKLGAARDRAVELYLSESTPTTLKYCTITEEDDTMTTTTNTLYKVTIDGIEQYATLIGRDGSLFVVKLSDSQKLISVSEVIEVMPDTVDIKFSNSYTSNKSYAFIVEDLSKWSVGDIVIPQGSNDMATVVAVNTKSKVAHKVLKGRKVLTETI